MIFNVLLICVTVKDVVATRKTSKNIRHRERIRIFYYRPFGIIIK